MQIYSRVKNEILQNVYSPGQFLPSVRQLAIELNVSRKTVEAAYDLLISEGYAESLPRKGTFVSTLHTDVGTSETKRAVHRDLQAPDEYPFDLFPGHLDPASFPFALWMKLQNRFFQNSGSPMSMYSDPQGEYSLRSALSQYLQRSRGVDTSPDRIIITSGLLESLTIIRSLIQNRVSSIAMEDPGYRIPREVFRDFSIHSIPLDESGVQVSGIVDSKADALYFTPSHQAPMGVIMSKERRKEIIAWAKTHDAYLIEDDYDAELRYNGMPIACLQGSYPGGRVFYISSVSKIISPAIRLGYLLIPEDLVDDCKMLKIRTTSVSLPIQATMAAMIQEGHWEKHILKMRVVYKRKHDTLIELISNLMGNHIQITGQGAGLHLILKFNKIRSEGDLVKLARNVGVGIQPLSYAYEKSDGFDGIIAPGFGNITLENLEKAAHKLNKAWFPLT